MITISSGHSSPLTIRLTDMTGKLIMSDQYCRDTCQMDVSSLQTGQYVIIVSDAQDKLIWREMVVIE